MSRNNFLKAAVRSGLREATEEGMKIRVIYKGVGEMPNRVELPSSIKALQASVGGAIEVHSFALDTAIVSNAFAIDKCLPYNCSFLGRDWYGPLLIVGFDGCSFCSLPEKAMEALEKEIISK